METGTNPTALWIGMFGWAKVGASSLASTASPSHDHDTAPADTPFHTSEVATTCRATCRMSLRQPFAVMMTVGSSWNGTR